MHDTPRTPNRRAKAAIGLAASALVLGGIGVAGAVTADDDAPGTSGSSATTSSEVTQPSSPDTSSEVTDTTTGDDLDEGSEAADDVVDGELPGPDDNFGQWVSAQAKEGGVDGQEISAAARARNEARQAAREDDGADESDVEDDADDASTHAGPPASNPGKGKGGPHS
jgi:hypothetical protein